MASRRDRQKWAVYRRHQAVHPDAPENATLPAARLAPSQDVPPQPDASPKATRAANSAAPESSAVAEFSASGQAQASVEAPVEPRMLRRQAKLMLRAAHQSEFVTES